MNRKTKNIKIHGIKTRFIKHGNLLQLLFVKNILKSGKNYLAIRVVQKAFFLVEHIFKQNYLKILESAVYNSRIEFDLKSITAKTSFLKLPREVDAYRAINLGIKNIIHLAKNFSKNSLSEGLCSAILETYYKKGSAVQKRKENLQIAQKYKTLLYEEIDS